MNFSNPLYFYFLAGSYIFFESIRRVAPPFYLRLTLLVFSYIFYAAWNPFYLCLIIVTTGLDYIWAYMMDSSGGRQRKFFLFLSVFINLSILGSFKYYSFLMGSFQELLSLFQIQFNPLPWNPLLPVGISFYTFQSLSYTIDVYRRVILAEKSILSYALYLSFFPQLVAGPIVLAKELLPKLHNIKHENKHVWNQIFFLFLLGYTKKSVVADNLAPMIEMIYGNPGIFTGGDWILCSILYSIQIYFDFSGYTDFARGSALMFGIELPENFLFPYVSISFSEFWKRWHISLSAWLRDYLYIPMGGSRTGPIQTSINLLITMLLGGLWHGASWNFVFWGGGHGLLLIAERQARNLRKTMSPVVTTGGKVHFLRFLTSKPIRVLIVFSFVTLLWIFFRSPDFQTSVLILTKIFSWKGGFIISYTDMKLALGVISIFVIGNSFGASRYQKFFTHLSGVSYGLSTPFFCFWLFAAILLSRESRPFLYFVF